MPKIFTPQANEQAGLLRNGRFGGGGLANMKGAAIALAERRGQVLGLVEIESGQEPVSPPERGGIGDLAALRGLGNRLAIDQRPRLITPVVPEVQSR